MSRTAVHSFIASHITAHGVVHPNERVSTKAPHDFVAQASLSLSPDAAVETVVVGDNTHYDLVASIPEAADGFTHYALAISPISPDAFAAAQAGDLGPARAEAAR